MVNYHKLFVWVIGFLFTLSPLTLSHAAGLGWQRVDDLPIKPSTLMNGWQWQDSTDNPEKDKENAAFRVKIYIGIGSILFILTAIGIILKTIVFLQDKAIRAYFSINLKPYSHAYCVGDETGISHGRYKLKFPQLMVGEVEFNVRGSRLRGGTTLILRDGVTLEFYDGDSILREEARLEKQDRIDAKKRFAAQHPENLAIQPSIFDRPDDEEEMA